MCMYIYTHTVPCIYMYDILYLFLIANISILEGIGGFSEFPSRWIRQKIFATWIPGCDTKTSSSGREET